MNRFSAWLVVLALTALGFYAYFGYVQRQAHSRLLAQLQQLNRVLNTENDRAGETSRSFIKGIEAKVLKNQSQPSEVAVLQTCQHLQARTAAAYFGIKGVLLPFPIYSSPMRPSSYP